ncbi:transketolase [Moorella thermoacetica Y72]|nr:transketolase [Moorella thermoacetica Y72]
MIGMAIVDPRVLTPLKAPVPAVKPSPGPIGKGTGAAVSFQAVLKEQMGGLKFSRHASERLESRGINLSAQQMARLEDGVRRAAGKGARESLVLLDDLALVVSVKNRTVITAAARQDLQENVFTNIDSAVLL